MGIQCPLLWERQDLGVFFKTQCGIYAEMSYLSCQLPNSTAVHWRCNAIKTASFLTAIKEYSTCCLKKNENLGGKQVDFPHLVLTPSCWCYCCGPAYIQNLFATQVSIFTLHNFRDRIGLEANDKYVYFV